MPEKFCTKCGKPGEFSKNKGRSDGMSAWCKICSKEWYDKNAEELRSKDRARRISDPEKCRAEDRAKYKAHPEKANSRSKAWRDAHPEHIKSYVQSEKAKASRLAWRDANPERFKALVQEWRRRNPAKVALRNQRRRMALAGLENTLTEDQWLEILEYFNYACAYCLKDDVPLTMEHMTPVSRGGATTIENIIPACGSCNSRKGARSILCMVNGGSDAPVAA